MMNANCDLSRGNAALFSIGLVCETVAQVISSHEMTLSDPQQECKLTTKAFQASLKQPVFPEGFADRQ